MQYSFLLALSLGSSAFAHRLPRRTASAYATPTPSSSSGASSIGGSSPGKVQYAGVNIAGCDFGLDTSGSLNGNAECPVTVGPTQMQHFVQDDGLNIFRLPIGWQHAVNNNPGGPLDDSYMQQYDTIVKSCLSLGAKCIVDLHNYARWNGGIVGQGGQCSNDDLASFWDQIVKRYQTEANFRNIVFGVMNEPHDLDMNAWATTVQTVVTRIRSSGATSQMILLPGTGYTSAAGFNTNSAPALSKVTNPDGSTSGLVYDVHKYFDSDSSGTSSSCKDDPQIDSAFGPLATYLKSAGRKALLTETGGGDGTDCTGQDGPVSKAFDFMAQNSDVFLGWVGWAAGSFKIDYTISETPSGSEDQPFLKDIIVGKFKGQGGYQRRH